MTLCYGNSVRVAASILVTDVGETTGSTRLTDSAFND